MLSDLIEVCRGPHCAIFMTKAVQKQYSNVDSARRARCEKWMRMYANGESHLLDSKKLNFEGRWPTKVSKPDVVLLAFKAWQLRLYGGMCNGTLIITEIDTQKKVDAADQKMLKRAAVKLGEYL